MLGPGKQPLCCLYRDPETGMPYADIEAFRELRPRAAEGRPLQPKRAKRKRFGTGASERPPQESVQAPPHQCHHACM